MTFECSRSRSLREFTAASSLAIALSLGLGRATAAKQDAPPRDAPAAARQTAYRIRTDFKSPLNADIGWPGALNEEATVDVDQPFRIRFELEFPGEQSGGRTYRLQCRRNDGEWRHVVAEDFPVPEEASPRVSIVSTGAYEHGAATTNVLSASSAPFAAGAGVSLADATPSWSGDSVHSEWEWPLVIRRFADGAVTSESGDVLEFRMVAADGGRIDAVAGPRITVNVPEGHLGGTFVETPGRIGPWQATNGDLYFIMEPAETDNLLMMVKSTDGGASWQEVDGADRPKADDLEGVASVLWNDTIYILHQTSDEVWLHSFCTSDHPTNRDQWDVRDELVATPEEPPVQVASIAVRSDGSLVGFYGGPEKVHFKTRSADGAWSEEQVLGANRPPDLSGPQAVVDRDDVVHIAYTGRDGTAWYRSLAPDGALTPRVLIANELGATENDVGSILPLAYLPEFDSVVVIYRLASGRLWERRIAKDGRLSEPVQVTARSVVQNAVDSDQTGADAISDGATVHVLFIDDNSRDIYHATSGRDDAWQPAKRLVEGINGQWIRASVLQRKGRAPAIGYVYDAGSDGGSGMNRFSVMPLESR
ncbi:MAG: exo-alpha-sialidase [Planctomycetota bacterium]